MQEIITYLILAATISYVVYRTFGLFLKKENASGCVSGGCSSCSFGKSCNDNIVKN